MSKILAMGVQSSQKIGYLKIFKIGNHI